MFLEAHAKTLEAQNKALEEAATKLAAIEAKQNNPPPQTAIAPTGCLQFFSTSLLATSIIPMNISSSSVSKVSATKASAFRKLASIQNLHYMNMKYSELYSIIDEL